MKKESLFDDCPSRLLAASVRRSLSFPPPHPFHPNACKRRQSITDPASNRSPSVAAAISPRSPAASSSRRSSENYRPAKPLPRQIPIAGQLLTALPRVPSSEAFGRRPPTPGRSLAPGRHPKPFPKAAVKGLLSTECAPTPIKRLVFAAAA